MHIGILSTHITPEEERLIEAGKERGHAVTVLEVLKFGINICPDEPRIFYEGQRVGDEFDAIIPRIDPPHTDFGYVVLRQFQAMDVYVTDTAYSLEMCRDKMRCLQYLMRKGVPFPATGYAYTKEGYRKVLKTAGDPPWVIKLNEGTEGVGVFLAEDKKQAKNFLRTFQSFDAKVMVQEFLSESSGEDIRVVVLGGKVHAALERKSQDGDFRSNVALGGHTTVVELTKEEEEVALKATEAMGLSMAGVDLMRTKNGPMIIEVNSAQDFTGPHLIEEKCGVDFAGMMIDFAVEGKKAFDKGEGVWLRQKNYIPSPNQ